MHLNNIQTGEQLNLSYCIDGEYDRESLSQVDHFLRDWRQNAVIPIDTRVLDIVALIQHAVGTDQPVTILSGYRTRQTNALLARSNPHVAEDSFHIHGMAIDLSLAGYDIQALSGFVRALSLGGVGFYPRQRFIHIDCGPVRYWSA